MKTPNKKLANMITYKKVRNGIYSASELHRKVHLTRSVCLHISEVSAVMVGICQAGVGLIHIANVIGKVDNYIDDLLAIDSVIFTIACVTAFWAFRSPNIRKTLRIGQTAEIFFVIGLGVMVLVSLLTAYSSLKK